MQDPAKIKRQAMKKRACIILRDLEKFPEVFFLVSISTRSYRLQKLRSVTYLQKVTRWWQHTKKWLGLSLTMNDPSVSETGEVTVKLSRLLQLLSCFPESDIVQIVLPHNGSSPSTSFSFSTWDVRAQFSWELVHMLMMEESQGSQGGGDGVGDSMSGIEDGTAVEQHPQHRQPPLVSQQAFMLLAGNETIL
ncbi:hypothetical protein FISHEDRAFT_62894 [Fistulina hepatica ATCC 64428]|uniref:Uncharacterized protein n=1 Tax=Fistulina hepatica ATCC 64428 TaxID=1128425 RepID=A0A0D7A018_9AGAR|nr:hypothetical protein FISHEDRAFT_62894 [Fistulina hepatica ATCC 64428]